MFLQNRSNRICGKTVGGGVSSKAPIFELAGTATERSRPQTSIVRLIYRVDAVLREAIVFCVGPLGHKSVCELQVSYPAMLASEPDAAVVPAGYGINHILIQAGDFDRLDLALVHYINAAFYGCEPSPILRI